MTTFGEEVESGAAPQHRIGPGAGPERDAGARDAGDGAEDQPLDELWRRVADGGAGLVGAAAEALVHDVADVFHDVGAVDVAAPRTESITERMKFRRWTPRRTALQQPKIA